MAYADGDVVYFDTWLGQTLEELARSRANKLPQVLISGNEVFVAGSNEVNKGYLVAAYSVYDAAAKVCGVDPSSLDETARSKLSNASTGGRFYSWCQTWGNCATDGERGWMGSGTTGPDEGMYIGTTFASTAAVAFGGADKLWWVETSSADLASAREDLNVVKNGGSLGGFGEYIDLDLTTNGLGIIKNAYENYSDINDIYLYATEDMKEWLESDSNRDIIVNSTTTGLISFFVRRYDDGLTVTYDAQRDGRDQYCIKVENNTDESLKFYTYTIQNLPGTNKFLTEIPDKPNVFQYTFNNNESISSTGSATTVSAGSSRYIYPANTSAQLIGYSSTVQGGETGLPTSHWPDPPSTPGGGEGIEPEPIAPDIPDPELREVPYPEPVSPTPYAPSPPTVNPEPPSSVPFTPITYTPTAEPTGTSPQDYTPWLRAILLELQSTHAYLVSLGNRMVADIDTHCQHITGTIRTQAQWLMTNVTAVVTSAVASINAQVHSDAVWLGGTFDAAISGQTDDITAYMQRQMEWLAGMISYLRFDSATILSRLDDLLLAVQSMRFDYDASSTDAILQQILAEIRSLDVGGGGGGTSVSLDLSVVEDYLDDINLELQGISLSWSSDLGDLSDLLASIDDNVAGILGILQDWPEYPTVSVPQVSLTGVISAIEDFNADFTDYGDYVENELVGFSQQLDDVIATLGDIYRNGVTITVDMTDLQNTLDAILLDVEQVGTDVRDFWSDFGLFWSDLGAYLDSIIESLDAIEMALRSRRVNPYERPTGPGGEIVLLEDDLNIDALKDALRRLFEKFPFSTINNLVLIITALTRPAVTPVFDVPCPNPSDWSSPYSVHVDLSDWDTVAATMRVGIMLWVIARVSKASIRMWQSE